MAKKADSNSHSMNNDGLPFPKAFNHFIRIDVRCVQYSDENPYRFLDWLRSCSIVLCKEISRTQPRLQIVLWLGLFVFSEAETVQSILARQQRGCFLIGVSNLEDESQEWMELLRQDVAVFEKELRAHPVFIDEQVPPAVDLLCVERAQLGRLVVDRWMWPQAGKSSLFFTDKKIVINANGELITRNAASNGPAVSTSAAKL